MDLRYRTLAAEHHVGHPLSLEFLVQFVKRPQGGIRTDTAFNQLKIRRWVFGRANVVGSGACTCSTATLCILYSVTLKGPFSCIKKKHLLASA